MGLTNKTPLDIFLQKGDVTEHEWRQVCVDVASPPFHLGGGGYGYT